MKRIKWFSFVLAAIAFVGCSDDNAETPPPATEPVVLTTPKVTFTVTETSVAFSWEAVEHASGYEYRLQKASETVKEAKVDAETLQALVDVPKGSEIYILKVRALGTGDYTDSEWSRNTVLTPEPKPTNIEFADAVLEKYLLSMQPSIDLDGDGKISFEEAAAVTEIDAGYEYAEDATADNTFSNLSGLEYFTSLERLNLKYHRVSDATPIEGLASLTSLNLGENQITKLDLSKLANLTDLRLYGTGVSTLDLSKTPLLKSLYLQRTALTEIDLSPLTDLEEAYINKAKLTKLRAVGLKGLTRLDAVKNALTTVEIGKCDELSQLHLDNNRLTAIELKGLPKLMILNLYANSLTALDTSNLPFLMQLSVFENQIASVDFSANPALRNVYLTQNPLTKIDLSANENIMLLEAVNMSNLEEINLKNGYCDDWAEYYIVEGNPALKKVIVDPGYEFELVTTLFKNRPDVSIVTE